MKGLCLYIMAGKGHYIPAKAVNEQLVELGVDSQLVDVFDFLHCRFYGRINQWVWRRMLAHSSLEKTLFPRLDKSKVGFAFVTKLCYAISHRRLRKYIETERPDFFFATHPYAGAMLASIVHRLGMNVPVLFYSTDVFSAPVVSISPYLYRFYLPTEEGIERVKAMGQPPESLALCPFPLQSSVAQTSRLGKAEARRKLDLDEDMFTIQLNLGGEGLGSLKLLEELLRRNIPVQIVILGGIKDHVRSHIEDVVGRQHSTAAKVQIRGFVNNVDEYLAASDIIVGRAGINTIVEAIAAHRPFMITELVYIVIASAEYIEKYKVGWNTEGDTQLQIGIIEDLIANPQKLDQMEEAFAAVPLVYSAKGLAEQVIRDVEAFK